MNNLFDAFPDKGSLERNTARLTIIEVSEPRILEESGVLIAYPSSIDT